MKIFNGIKDLGSISPKGCVLTLGNFDGVHLGHRQLIERVVELAEARGVPSVVFTFSPHPVEVLHPEKEFKKIFSQEDQCGVFASLGVSILNREPFDDSLSQLGAEDFFENYLRGPFQPSTIIMGYDGAFGADKEGGLDFLEKVCQVHGIFLEVIPALIQDDEVVSSSLIRRLIQQGQVDQIPRYLGRSFYLEGEVIRGDQRGRGLGFPTANLVCPQRLQVALGVYVTRVYRQGEAQPHLAVTNVGVNLTFGKDQLSVETHILDFQGDLYGQCLRVEFLEFLRSEQRFPSVEALVEQIERDITKARNDRHKYTGLL